MNTPSTSDTITLGTRAGARLLDDIKNAKKSVKIISPYLSPSYVEELIRLKGRGVDVTLITSDDVQEGDGQHSGLRHTDLIRQERHTDEAARRKRTMGMEYTGLSFMLPIAYYLLHLPTAWFWSLTLLSLMCSGLAFLHFSSIRVYSYTYSPVFRLRVFHSQYHKEQPGPYLVHSKVYVVDDEAAYVGSVNFSYPSTMRNYECVVRVTDRDAVGRISREIDSLFDSKELYSRPIDEWGRRLYAEPAH